MNQQQILFFQNERQGSTQWQELQRVVNLSRGEMNVELEPAIGLSLKLSWISAKVQSGTLNNQRQQVVVLAEDNHLVRRATRRMLAQLNLKVFEASTGQEALALIDRLAHVDLLISDVLMPKMSGVEVLEALRQRGDLLPTLLLSAMAEPVPSSTDSMSPQTSNFTAEFSNYAYLRKPVEAATFLMQVKELLLTEPQSSTLPRSGIVSRKAQDSVKLENTA